MELVDDDYHHNYMRTIVRLKVEDNSNYYPTGTSKSGGAVFRMFNLYDFYVSMFKFIYCWNVQSGETYNRFREVKPNAIPLGAVEIRR